MHSLPRMRRTVTGLGDRFRLTTTLSSHCGHTLHSRQTRCLRSTVQAVHLVADCSHCTNHDPQRSGSTLRQPAHTKMSAGSYHSHAHVAQRADLPCGHTHILLPSSVAHGIVHPPPFSLTSTRFTRACELVTLKQLDVATLSRTYGHAPVPSSLGLVGSPAYGSTHLSRSLQASRTHPPRLSCHFQHFTHPLTFRACGPHFCTPRP